MKPQIAIIQFPGSNTERETIMACERVGLDPVEFLWNEDAEGLEVYQGYIIVGGFSYEDRSRSGIIAALEPIIAQIKVEATLVSEYQEQRGEIYWNVVKDDHAKLSSVSSRLVLGETVVIDTEYVEGQKSNNYRVGNEWYEGRDEIPEYSNPFIKLAQSATENPDGFWPPFAFDTAQLIDLEWSITADISSTQQIASSSNETHSIFIETMGIPPIITGIETYSGEDKFILQVTTENISLSLRNDIQRTPAPFIPNPFPKDSSENISYWSGVISNSLSLEIRPEQLEIHGLVSENNYSSSVSVMKI